MIPSMASMPALKAPTVYEQFLAVDPNRVAEIVHGQLRTFPRPASRHARAASKLGMRIGAPFDDGEGGPGGWLILDEPELRIHGHILVPDLAGWRRTRMPEMPDAPFFEIAPDWVCEVLSPSTAAHDRVDKLPLYASFGVGHAWLVDPLAETLEVFERERGTWKAARAFRGAESVRAAPFDEIPLELAALWAR